MLTRLLIGAAAIGVNTIVFATSSYAQGADIGKQEYIYSCADCHGVDGKGNGPVAQYLKPKVPDLTVLARNNTGVFPFARVYDVIDGRQEVAIHGPRDMLIWGNEYREELGKYTGGYATLQDRGSYARGKIISLIGYIDSLQAK